MTDAEEFSDDDLAVRQEMARLRTERENLHTKIRPLLGPAMADAVFSSGALSALHDVTRRAMADTDPAVLDDLVFHLTDWRADAGCLLALIAHPQLFTENEVRTILQRFLTHAPNHIAAAALLSGHPIQDVFKLGPLIQDD